MDSEAWTALQGVRKARPAVRYHRDPDLIQKRTQRIVPTGPGGTLDHYIPFYFTPCSMMLYNIRTGWNNMTRRTPQELVFFVASLRSLAAHGISFVFSDRHAILSLAMFSTSLNDIDHLGWQYWQQRDFRRDSDRPEKTELYQAEALVHRHLPPAHLNGIVCSDADSKYPPAKPGALVVSRSKRPDVAATRPLGPPYGWLRSSNRSFSCRRSSSSCVRIYARIARSSRPSVDTM